MASRIAYRDGGDEILAEINIIPLVDISLVLLIIFMVTANYIMSSSLVVDLPQAAHAKAITQKNSVSITISREGPLYLDSELVTTAELKKKMQSFYKANPGLTVILSVDKSVNFKNVVKILDLLSELGINKLNIAAIAE